MKKKLDQSRKAIRQGDVLVVPVTDVPSNTVPVQPESHGYVLAHGEATGHHHSIAFSDRVAMFREDGSGGGLFLQVNAPVELVHQEHTALKPALGLNKVLRQRTYSSGAARRVAD